MHRLTRTQPDPTWLQAGRARLVDNPRAFDHFCKRIPAIPTIVQQLHTVVYQPHRRIYSFAVRYFDSNTLHWLECREDELPYCPGEEFDAEILAYQLEMWAVAQWKKAHAN